MLLFNAITLLFLGIITVPTLFLPGKWAQKIAPYREYIGIIYLIVGLLEILLCILNPIWFDFSLLTRIIMLVCAIDKIIIGFILGFNSLVQIFKKGKRKANVNMEWMHFKTTMGLISFGFGICLIVLFFVL